MIDIPNRRRIIDRKALGGAVAALVEAHGHEGRRLRPALLALLKESHAAGRAEVRRRFDAGASGAETMHALAFLMDQIVRVLFETANERVYPAANPTTADRLCVAAVGGYGRFELAPYSDVDLLFLLPYKTTPRLEQVIEYMLLLLWDMGLKVGHATRSVDECIRLSKADTTISTSLLESRYICGDRSMFDALKTRFEREIVAASGPEFVEAKLAERDARHHRLGDSRYVLEPNLKEGKGGLRDLQTLYWIAKFLYRVDDVAELVEKGVLTAAEARRFDKAHEFLRTVRCHLHYLADRGEDRLTFDRQEEIARRLGYTDHAGTLFVERFMKHYYLHAKQVGDLTRIFCAALEAEHRRRPRFSLSKLSLFQREVDGFPVEHGWLNAPPGAFRERPVDILRLFHIAQARELDVHPQALRAITRNLRRVDGLREDPEANRLFLEMLTSRKDPETTLRRLNEAGVFGRFLPDFGRVVAQMQHDMYHVYTVDEHTIRAVGVLHGIETGRYADEMPVATEVVHKVHSRTALYVALLLHDIAKGRGGDHSRIGAEIAVKLGPRFGLSEEETETVQWLVLHHLALSNTAFHRDSSDPKTVSDFVDLVQSVERLRLLIVLTAADIRAVGPNVWNNWKAALLRELYFAAEEMLSGGLLTEGRERRVAAAKEAARAAMSDFADEEAEAFLAAGYPSYWLSLDAETHARHARLIRAARREDKPLTIETRQDPARGVTEVTIYCGDHPGLFSRIAGGMALAGANIVDAKIFTMADGMALDTFWVQDANGAPFERTDKLAGRIEQTLAGRLRPQQELAKRTGVLPSRASVFKVAPRVIIDNAASRTHTVVEVNGRDRPGLLYELTLALTRVGVQITSAAITTYGEKAVDVFYIKDLFGLQITHEVKLQQIKGALLAVLAEPEAATTERAASVEAAAE